MLILQKILILVRRFPFFGRLANNLVKGLRKNSLCKINEEPTAKIDGSSLQEGYEYSKTLWDYKNIFSFPDDAWFLSILNYPDSEHWMLIGIHARSKVFLIYDPQGEGGQKESIRNTIISVYIEKEANIVYCIFGISCFYFG